MKQTGPQVLVADDDRTFVDMIRVNLEHSGCRVVTAYDGEDALEKIEKIRPDVAIIDLMMPRIDGYTLDLELQDEKSTSEIPVIIITGHSELKRLFRKTKEARVAAWFDKSSFSVHKLVSKIKELTRRGRTR